MTSRLTIFQPKLDELLTGPTGPVYRAVRTFAEAVVAEVKEHGPISEPQYGRPPGLLREDMRIRHESVNHDGLTITVGTDPENPRDGTHYAAIVHRGRAAIDSASIMHFTYGGFRRSSFHVASAEPLPFLYNAVHAVNAVSTGPSFGLREE